MRRQVKEIRVAAAVIPALKDKSIERDFRTLKRDRLVADIPMWDSCFFVLKDRIVKAGADEESLRAMTAGFQNDPGSVKSGGTTKNFVPA